MLQNIIFTDQGEKITINRATYSTLLSIQIGTTDSTTLTAEPTLDNTFNITDPDNILNRKTAIAIVAYLWNNREIELTIDGFKILYSKDGSNNITISQNDLELSTPIPLSYDIIIKGIDVYKNTIANNTTTSYGIHLSTSEVEFIEKTTLQRYEGDRYMEYIDHVERAREQEELDKKIVDKINHGLKNTLLGLIDTYKATSTEAFIMLRNIIAAGEYYERAQTEPSEEREKILNHITLLGSKKAAANIYLSEQITRIEEYKKICFEKGINLDDITFPERKICAPRELTEGENAAAIAQIITSGSFHSTPQTTEPKAKIAKIAETIASLEPIIETQIYEPRPKSPPHREKLKALHNTGNTHNDRSSSITYGAKKMPHLGNMDNIDGQENFYLAPHHPDEGRDVLGENYEFLLDSALLQM